MKRWFVVRIVLLFGLSLMVIPYPALSEAWALSGVAADGSVLQQDTLGLTTPAATFTVNSTGDLGDCNTADGICSTRDPAGRCTGPCTLRAAIEQANASPGAHVINFAPGITTIRPGSEYPLITKTVTIDGTANGRVEIDGTNVEGGSTQYSPIGLHISAGNSTVRGLVINRFQTGIRLTGNGSNNVIGGNFIGTDVTGTIALGNGTGIYIDAQSSNNMIGGPAPVARNIISGNSYQLQIGQIPDSGASRNQVQGNFIGTDVTGTSTLGGETGIAIYSNNNRIARNVISGHSGSGVLVGTIVYAANGNLLEGNFIGTDVTGSIALASLSLF